MDGYQRVQRLLGRRMIPDNTQFIGEGPIGESTHEENLYTHNSVIRKPSAST